MTEWERSGRADDWSQRKQRLLVMRQSGRHICSRSPGHVPAFCSWMRRWWETGVLNQMWWRRFLLLTGGSSDDYFQEILHGLFGHVFFLWKFHSEITDIGKNSIVYVSLLLMRFFRLPKATNLDAFVAEIQSCSYVPFSYCSFLCKPAAEFDGKVLKISLKIANAP